MIRRLFVKLNMLWRRIPLQIRVVFNAVLFAAILSIPIYILSYELLLVNNVEGRVTLEAQRRLVGPSDYLGVVDYFVPESFSDPNGPVSYDRLVIAQTQDGVILCGYNTKDDVVENFNYIKKQGELTMTAAQRKFLHNDERHRGYVLFDDQQDAVRADVMIELKEINVEEPVYTLNMTSHRENPGYFFFRVLTEKTDAMENHIATLLRGTALKKYYCTAKIQLYNADDFMICQKEMLFDIDTIRSWT